VTQLESARTSVAWLTHGLAYLLLLLWSLWAAAVAAAAVAVTAGLYLTRQHVYFSLDNK